MPDPLLSAPGRVLVVDDHADSRELVVTHLAELGFHVLQTDSAEGCIRLMDEAEAIAPIHGAVVDLSLAMVEGHGVLSQIRRRDERVPVIVVSELTDINRAREAIRLGAAEYLVKPFDRELLRSKCLRVFSRPVQHDYPC